MEVENINFREVYYNDVHTMKPAWWMRWGVLSVFVIVLVILTLGYFMKYPDVIQAEVRLTTNEPSITLPLPQGSQIQHLLVKNGDTVTKGQHMIVSQNNSNYKHVLLLETALQHFVFDREYMLSFFDRFLNMDLQLGTLIENDWIAFSTELLQFYKIEKLESFDNQIEFLKKEHKRQLQLRSRYLKLIQTDKKEKKLLTKRLETDSTLYAKGVLSRMQYNEGKQKYYSSSKLLQQNQLNLKRIHIEITRLENAIANYGNDEQETLLTNQLGIRKSLNKLKSSIISWKKQFVMISPISGQIHFIQRLTEGKYYEGNAVVITPLNKQFYAALQIPFAGSGKAAQGQKVVLKLNDYPYREYGILEGALTDLSPVAGENYYLARVVIEENSVSSYGKEMLLKENMSGIGEIITNDRNVLGRIFEKITYAFDQ